MLIRNLVKNCGLFWTRPVVCYQNKCFFSDFFRQKDNAELKIYDLDKDHDKRYLSITNQIHKTRLKKQRSKEKKEISLQNKEPPQEEPQKLVVHNPAIGIEYPQKELFAVVEIAGFQHKVFATVEEQCLSEKVIVFKKKRRKNYKRTKGSKQKLTVLRIDRIEHELGDKELEKAVSLI